VQTVSLSIQQKNKLQGGLKIAFFLVLNKMLLFNMFLPLENEICSFSAPPRNILFVYCGGIKIALYND